MRLGDSNLISAASVAAQNVVHIPAYSAQKRLGHASSRSCRLAKQSGRSASRKTEASELCAPITLNMVRLRLSRSSNPPTIRRKQAVIDLQDRGVAFLALDNDSQRQDREIRASNPQTIEPRNETYTNSSSRWRKFLARRRDVRCLTAFHATWISLVRSRSPHSVSAGAIIPH